MRQILGLRHKQVRELELGELFHFSFSASSAGSSLAILIERGTNSEPVYGILQSPEFKNSMIWYGGSNGDHCVSYGGDWLFEERPASETAPSLTEHAANHVSSVFFDQQTLLMRFRPPQDIHNGQSIFFDLRSNTTLTGLSGHRAPLLQWLIWASDEHYRSPRSKPVFEFMTKS